MDCRHSAGEMVVLRDGVGFVVKRVGAVPRAELPTLRLISAKPVYGPCTCLADEAQIVGKVLRTIGRM